MQVKNAVFLTSAAREEQFLRPAKPMIAVCGKSNAGKSTLINMLAGRKNLAKTSAAPGRTRLVNYFDFGEFWLADLPGYGYAAVSKAEQAKWAKTLEAFFAKKRMFGTSFCSPISAATRLPTMRRWWSSLSITTFPLRCLRPNLTNSRA